MTHEMNPENLKLLFGIKVKSYRTGRGMSLQALSKRSGMAVSYLSEIESGKKYPKPEKLIRLAQALDIDYDDLVAIKADKSLDPFVALVNSDLVRQFPFHLFGIRAADIVGLFKNNAEHANAFLQTFLQISRVYDLSLENFLFAALRTYLRQHKNYFPDLEAAAEAFLRRQGRTCGPPTFGGLKALLEERHGYVIDETLLAGHPELDEFRSVLQGQGRLALNGRLMSRQKRFILARELGFIELNIRERPVTSSWIQVQSFEQLVNNFNASYFGGALLLNQHELADDLRGIFNNQNWNGESFASLLDKYRVTPEMLLYRISQVLPGVLGIEHIFYFRFTHTGDLQSVTLTKELNMTRTLLTYGLGINEHYCRRMLPMRFLNTLRREGGTLSGAQIIQFATTEDRFLLLSMARPLSLSAGRGSAIAVGIRLDRRSTSLIGFSDDPEIPFSQVSETCERCPLTDCMERVVSASIVSRRKRLKEREDALKRILISQ